MLWWGAGWWTNWCAAGRYAGDRYEQEAAADMKGTLAFSWGPPTRPYVYNGNAKRVVLGPLALTYVPDVEIEDLMRAYVDLTAMHGKGQR